MFIQWRNKNSFTIIETMFVSIILAVLISMATAQYFKTVEKTAVRKPSRFSPEYAEGIK